MSKQKPTPAQRRLLEAAKERNLYDYHWHLGTIIACHERGWIERHRDVITITPKGLEALK